MTAPLLSMATCPNCGAPHSLSTDRRILICIYCNTSLLVGRPPASGGAATNDPLPLSAQAVSKEDVERVKQLLVDGNRAKAVALYAGLAGVSPADAEAAVDAMVISSYFTLTRELPLNAFGFAGYMLFILAGLALAAWAAGRALDGAPAWFALSAAGALFAVTRIINFSRHIRSTYVCSFGATGRARVLRRAMLRETKDTYLIAVMFEVVPDDGGAPFVDQENLLVGNKSLQKLIPGNVVPVRFEGARARVFPISPVTVVASTA